MGRPLPREAWRPPTPLPDRRQRGRDAIHAGQFLRSQWETEPMAQPAMDR